MVDGSMVTWPALRFFTLSSVAEPGCSSEHLDLRIRGFGSFLLPGFQRDIYPKTPRTIKANALTK